MAALAACLVSVFAFLLCACSCSHHCVSPGKSDKALRPCIDGFLSKIHLNAGSSSVGPAIQPGFPVWVGENVRSSAYHPPVIGTDATSPFHFHLETVEDADNEARMNILTTTEYYASHDLLAFSLGRLKALLLWPINASRPFILTGVCRLFLLELRFISSSSMMPTLEIGDRVVVEKMSYFFKNPGINDIVLFRPPPFLQAQGYNSSAVFIKRVIAKAGDSVEVKDGQIFVNGVARVEEFTAGPSQYKMSLLLVPKGSVFVLGDNRNRSNDSHIWGPLPIRNILGRAVLRYSPPERAGSILWEEAATSSSQAVNSEGVTIELRQAKEDTW